MVVFLAPVPILHVQAMLDDIRQGHGRFAFGSSALDFFERSIVRNCEGENIPVYIYVSKSGESRLNADADKQLGIFIQGRLAGWVMGDNRGQYPKTGLARRPGSAAANDGPMALFWEIDNVKRLADRMPISDFVGIGGKPLADNFVPQGPMLVSRGMDA